MRCGYKLLLLAVAYFSVSPSSGATDLLLRLPPQLPNNLYNPSLTALQRGVFVAAFRETNVTRTGRGEQWSNTAYLCSSTRPTFINAQCMQWRPFSNDRRACTWTNGIDGTDTDGIEDPKLCVWPGKGRQRQAYSSCRAIAVPHLMVNTVY